MDQLEQFFFSSPPNEIVYGPQTSIHSHVLEESTSHSLIANLFEKGIGPWKQEFPEKKIKRQVLDHYLPGISNITSHYGIITIEILPPQSSNQPPHRIKTDDTESDFSKVFTDYTKNIQHQNSQMANSIFKNYVFISYSFFSNSEKIETYYVSPPQTSWHAIVRRKWLVSQEF